MVINLSLETVIAPASQAHSLDSASHSDIRMTWPLLKILTYQLRMVKQRKKKDPPIWAASRRHSGIDWGSISRRLPAGPVAENDQLGPNQCQTDRIIIYNRAGGTSVVTNSCCGLVWYWNRIFLRSSLPEIHTRGRWKGRRRKGRRKTLTRSRRGRRKMRRKRRRRRTRTRRTRRTRGTGRTRTRRDHLIICSNIIHVMSFRIPPPPQISFRW